MTLSTPDPWRKVLAEKTSFVTMWLGRIRPELGTVGVSVDRAVVLTMSAPEVSHMDAMWTLARSVASWWPGWLGPLNIECRIIVGPLHAVVPAGVMVDLAEFRINRAAWFDAVRPTIGSDLRG